MGSRRVQVGWIWCGGASRLLAVVVGRQLDSVGGYGDLVLVIGRSSDKMQTSFMKAVVYDRYGPPDVLRLEDVAQPVPKRDEVLVRIYATTVSRADCATREANRRSGLGMLMLSRCQSGSRAPRQRILGGELAGVVKAVGAAVSEFAVGDQVFGRTGFSFGAHAEYICMRQSAQIVHKPRGMTFEEAAAVCDGAFYALSCLRVAHPHNGQRILIYGASGAIGTAAVQLWCWARAEARHTLPPRRCSRRAAGQTLR